MTHKDQQLKYCKICKLKGFDPNRGIICSLTNNYPTFDTTCETFDKDWNLAKLDIQKEQQSIIDKEKEEEKITIISDIRVVIGIIVLIFMGVGMIKDPELFKNIDLDGRRVFIKSIFKLIWGYPTGIILLLVAGFLCFRFLKSKAVR